MRKSTWQVQKGATGGVCGLCLWMIAVGSTSVYAQQENPQNPPSSVSSPGPGPAQQNAPPRKPPQMKASPATAAKVQENKAQ